jgi:hypothetical protein
MLRKLVLSAAVAAAIAAPTAALAGGHGHHMPGWHGGGVRWHGHPYWHRGWYGPWGYGGGSCWRWDPYAGGWVWVCY